MATALDLYGRIEKRRGEVRLEETNKRTLEQLDSWIDFLNDPNQLPTFTLTTIEALKRLIEFSESALGSLQLIEGSLKRAYLSPIILENPSQNIIEQHCLLMAPFPGGLLEAPLIRRFLSITKVYDPAEKVLGKKVECNNIFFCIKKVEGKLRVAEVVMYRELDNVENFIANLSEGNFEEIIGIRSLQYKDL